jgi:LysM repeat protein
MKSSSSAFLLFLLGFLVAVSKAATFTCNATATATCKSIIGYVSTNASTYGNISSLFQVSLTSIISENNLSSVTSNSTTVSAGATVKVPIPCLCANGTGRSDRIPVYTIQPGDGLYTISSNKFDLFANYTEIANANNISDPNKIEAGKTLYIPLPCSCDPVNGKKVMHLAYHVESGNTTAGIAAMYGTTESTLLKLNGISDPKSLMADQILDVPLEAGTKFISTRFSYLIHGLNEH